MAVLISGYSATILFETCAASDRSIDGRRILRISSVGCQRVHRRRGRRDRISGFSSAAPQQGSSEFGEKSLEYRVSPDDRLPESHCHPVFRRSAQTGPGSRRQLTFAQEDQRMPMLGGKLRCQRIAMRLAIRALVADVSGLRSTGVRFRLNILASHAMNAGFVSSVARCAANARGVSWVLIPCPPSARWLI